MNGALDPAPGKDDSENRRGLWVNTNTSATQVWSAVSDWEDTLTPAARAPGMVWPADSGLNWDEKYSRWIEAMEQVDGLAGYYQTFALLMRMTPCTPESNGY